MRRVLLASTVALGAAMLALAHDSAKDRLDKSPRHQEWVKLKQGSRELQCFIVYPEVKERALTVILIHEIFGLTDWVRGVADRLAEEGYIAMAPDLLSGMGPKGGGSADLPSRDAVVRAVFSLPPDQVTADLDAVSAYAAKLPAGNGQTCVAGFCWGGRQTFRYATHNPDLRAAFVFYGEGPTRETDIARIRCPVYGFYGGNDARVDASIPGSVQLMKKADKTYEPVTYEGAGHGFLRAGAEPDASEANRKAHDQAWRRWLALLKKSGSASAGGK